MSRRHRRHRDSSSSGEEDDEKFFNDLQDRHMVIDSKFRTLNFNPLEHAIGLFLNKEEKSIKNDTDEINSMMESVVSRYYPQFNKAISNYSNIMNLMDETMVMNDIIVRDVDVITDSFSSRASEVEKHYRRIITYDYIIKYLDGIEMLKHFPEVYGEHIMNKEYLEAGKLLVKSYEDVNSGSLDDIGALSGLKKCISVEFEKYRQVIVELLHQIVYMKSDSAIQIVVNVDINDKSLGLTEIHRIDNFTIFEDTGINATRNRLSTLNRLVLALGKLKAIGKVVDDIMNRARNELRLSMSAIMKNPTLPEKNYRHNDRIISIRQGKGSNLEHNEHSKLLVAVLRSCKKIVQNHKILYERIKNLHRTKGDLPNLSELTVEVDQVPHYKLEFIWDSFRLELQALIGVLLNVNTSDVMPTSLDIGGPSHKLFEFANSGGSTEYEKVDIQDQINYEQFLAEPGTASNIRLIYPIVLKYTNSISKIIGATNSSVMGLKIWIDDLVEGYYLEQESGIIKQDYIKRVEAICTPSYLKTVKDKSLQNSRHLVFAFIEIQRFVDEIHMYCFNMVSYSTKFYTIMEDILKRFIRFLQNQIDKIMINTEVHAYLQDEENHSFLKNHPKLQKEEFAEDEMTAYFAQELIREEVFFQGLCHSDTSKRLTTKQLISNISNLTLLAHLHDSIMWLKVGGTKSNPNWVPNPVLKGLIKKLHRMARYLIIAIRTEFRLQIFAHHDKIREERYVIGQEEREPDKYIKDLLKYLAEGEVALTKCLRRQRKEFVLSGLLFLGNAVFMRGVGKIEAFNRNGLNRIGKNIFSFHKTLSSIVPEEDHYFNPDKVQKYYQLLNLGSKEKILQHVVHHISEMTNIFTFEEYVTIIEAIEGGPIDGESRRFLIAQFKDINDEWVSIKSSQN